MIFQDLGNTVSCAVFSLYIRAPCSKLRIKNRRCFQTRSFGCNLFATCYFVHAKHNETSFAGIYVMYDNNYKLIIFSVVDVYLNSPIKIVELMKLDNQSNKRFTCDREKKDNNNYF